jgi:hypothetical protein
MYTSIARSHNLQLLLQVFSPYWNHRSCCYGVVVSFLIFIYWKLLVPKYSIWWSPCHVTVFWQVLFCEFARLPSVPFPFSSFTVCTVPHFFLLTLCTVPHFFLLTLCTVPHCFLLRRDEWIGGRCCLLWVTVRSKIGAWNDWAKQWRRWWLQTENQAGYFPYVPTLTTRARRWRNYIPQNGGNCPPIDTTWHPWAFACSATPLWETQIAQFQISFLTHQTTSVYATCLTKLLDSVPFTSFARHSVTSSL